MDESDFCQFNFDFAVATTMLCDHVDYETAVEMVREEMRYERYLTTHPTAQTTATTAKE